LKKDKKKINGKPTLENKKRQNLFIKPTKRRLQVTNETKNLTILIARNNIVEIFGKTESQKININTTVIFTFKL